MDEMAIIGIIIGVVWIVLNFVFEDYHRLKQTRAGIKAYVTYIIMVILVIILVMLIYPFLLPY